MSNPNPLPLGAGSREGSLLLPLVTSSQELRIAAQLEERQFHILLGVVTGHLIEIPVTREALFQLLRLLKVHYEELDQA